MSQLLCEVRGVRAHLPPRHATYKLGTGSIWAMDGAFGPRPLSARALDLIDLAGAIYRAESQIQRRATDPAVYWNVTVPVREPKFWGDVGGPLLAATLGFLNRARWQFTFVPRGDAPDLRRPDPDERAVNEVLLFSGGMDSVCGAGVHSTARGVVRLVSFYSYQRSLQRDLAGDLGYEAPSQWRLIGRRGKEGMNLIRSFMFLCLGAAVAESFGAGAIYQYENGVLGTVVPQSGNYIPTRHAHPEVHRRLERLLATVFDRAVMVANPFLELTKREVGSRLQQVVGAEQAEALLRRTETCWYLAQPQVGGVAKAPQQPCGACTPCIVRRTARPHEAEAGAWPGWPGYRFDLTLEEWREHPRLGLTFRAYLELVDIALRAGRPLADRRASCRPKPARSSAVPPGRVRRSWPACCGTSPASSATPSTSDRQIRSRSVDKLSLALSVRQPWAELIISGAKTLELRSWDTDYRGPLWLHAGLHADPALDARFAVKDPPRGAFVGQVELTSTSPIDPDRWASWRRHHLDPGPYQPGMFAWALAMPRRLRSPVPAPGRLKLFAIEGELLERLLVAAAG